jgi:hypothetical protein
MRSKTLWIVFLSVLIAGSFFFGHDAFAKKFGGGGLGRIHVPSGPPSSPKPVFPPSSGYGNTGIKPETGKNPSGYGNSGVMNPGAVSTPPSGYGNSATPSQGMAGPAGLSQSKMTPLQQRMNRSFSKQESAKAYEDYRAQQAKFQISSKPGAYRPSAGETTTINTVQSRTGYGSASDYYSRRTVFYDNYGWSPPVYVYRSFNSFGIWDAMMLWFMLDHINDAQYAAMYYNHRDDPGMQQFRKELDRLSQENEDLKAKVAKLDDSAKSLEQQGVKPDPAYMPQDAAGVALAADIATQGSPKSSGFPWALVFGIGAVAVAVMLLRRKR